ncbi:MAG: ATP-binding cassette domain-containing protein [Salinivirgaceae bacterium]|jgi:ABC-2 type transport system ATP-binding protein|nr:ATP-binding cassette domain-containing protein [Salinivirgaceae bacterium]
MNILQSISVNKQFANHKALHNVNIDVPTGKIFGLLGPNGAGKTTLIRIINQITGPDSGQILFKGRQLESNDVQNIGYLPEERGLYKKMKVGEQAIYLARLKGLSRNDAIKKLKFWFEKFEIQPWWDKKVEELSKGMQQKIQFVVTILHEPELLIFDEPFSGFDPINANLMKNEILNLKENGSTIIFSTHNMASVEAVCDNIALINNSVKILDGGVDEIKQNFKSNLIECQYNGDFQRVSALIEGKINIIEHRQNHTTHYLKGELNQTNNEFVSLILPEATLTSFNEVVPSMDDIFIKVVENDK